jgi:GrpB-like predicted nucleotidyltransferase (UPF0157 family)
MGDGNSGVDGSGYRPSGYRPATFSVVAYDPAWPGLFADEAEQLREALGPAVLAIEHVGSTAVPGLAAKPIIDILAAIAPSADARWVKARLESIGYLHTPESSAPARIFRKGPADMALLRTHHLHLTDLDGHYWRRIIAFRDHLRRHSDDAVAYAELKRDLAARFADDRRSFTRGKHSSVASIEQRAGIGHGPCDTCGSVVAGTVRSGPGRPADDGGP